MEGSAEEEWSYLAEGKNHIVLKSNGKVLRIRKKTNLKYYSDPNLILDETTYNSEVFRKSFIDLLPDLRKYIDWHTQVIDSKEANQLFASPTKATKATNPGTMESWLVPILTRDKEKRIKNLEKEGRFLPYSGTLEEILENEQEFQVDFDYPTVRLMNDFQNELAPALSPVHRQFIFEIKPKSQAQEHIPEDILEEMKAKGLETNLSKFQIVQYSRLFKKQQTEHLKYDPRKLFSGTYAEFTTETGHLFEHGEHTAQKDSQLITYASLQEVSSEEGRHLSLAGNDCEDLRYAVYGLLRESGLLASIAQIQNTPSNLEEAAKIYEAVLLPWIEEMKKEEGEIVADRVKEELKLAAEAVARDLETDKEQKSGCSEEEGDPIRKAWKTVVSVLLAETAKDFTILAQIIDLGSFRSSSSVSSSPVLPEGDRDLKVFHCTEEALAFIGAHSADDLEPLQEKMKVITQGKDGEEAWEKGVAVVIFRDGTNWRMFAAALGVVDLEMKLFTKLKKYSKAWKDHLINYIRYHGQ